MHAVAGEPPALHVFRAEEDWVVAQDYDHARRILIENCDYDPDSIDEESVTPLPDDHPLLIFVEPHFHPDECECAVFRILSGEHNKCGHDRGCPITEVVKPCAEWAKENGPGPLCSLNS